MHLHHVGQPDRSADRRAVADEVERHVLVERRVDGVVRTGEGDRVAVGRRAERRRHADIAAGAGPVLDDELLPQVIRQVLADDARDDVVGAARRERDDPAHRPRRIGLRARDAGGDRQRGRAGGETAGICGGEVSSCSSSQSSRLAGRPAPPLPARGRLLFLKRSPPTADPGRAGGDRVGRFWWSGKSTLCRRALRNAPESGLVVLSLSSSASGPKAGLKVRIEKHPPCHSRLAWCEARKRSIPRC